MPYCYYWQKVTVASNSLPIHSNFHKSLSISPNAARVMPDCTHTESYDCLTMTCKVIAEEISPRSRGISRIPAYSSLIFQDFRTVGHTASTVPYYILQSQENRNNIWNIPLYTIGGRSGKLPLLQKSPVQQSIAYCPSAWRFVCPERELYDCTLQ